MEMRAPLVSIILLTIDRPQFLAAAIKSVIAQTFNEWELIVLHDGLDPRIEPVVAEWVRCDRRVRYLHREEIGNIANGLNYAIRRSQGSLIAILDDDDAWIEVTKLERQVAALDACSELMAVGGGAVVVDSKGNEVMRYSRSLDSNGCSRHALLANPLIHSTVLYRREAAERVGLYDEGLAGYQDWDLFLKIMRIGRVANLDLPLASYRVWDGSGSSRKVLGNAWSTIRIVVRHRRNFRGFWTALSAGLAYVALALFPSAMRPPIYQALSRLKKKMFSS